MIKSENHIFAGLQQDVTISKQQPEYLIDAHNIRITAREGETLLSVTNERGPESVSLIGSTGDTANISGTILGHCVLNNYLVLFTHSDSEDNIYRIDMSKDNPIVINLFQGEGNNALLGFDVNYPIEAIGDYENENVQKVYWTDGKNQPRVINITGGNNPDNPNIYKWSGDFDFVPTLSLSEGVVITKDAGANGQFPAGVIQYALTYYNKHGQETNIFYTSPLYYISFYDRGASPEEVVSNAFTIKVTAPDTHFDYLRIYSILRTSLDATPICKRVQDIEINGLSSVSYIDTGTNGDNIEPSSLLYKGGEDIIAKDICIKDGTLFLGNLKINRTAVNDITWEETGEKKTLSDEAKTLDIETKTTEVSLTAVSSSNTVYSYYNGLNTQAAGFKNREYYRIGFQAQYKTGKWSDPVYINDFQVNGNGSISDCPKLDSNKLSKLIISCTISSGICTALANAGYKKIRPVVVFPEMQDRAVICQGVISPTVYNTSNWSTDNSINYKQASWFFRPILNGVTDETSHINSDFYTNTVCSPYSIEGTLPEAFAGAYNPKNMRFVEVQGYLGSDASYKVNWDVVTLNSPDITFDDSIQKLSLTSTLCNRIGKASFTNTLSDISLSTSSPTISSEGSGFIHKSFSSKYSNGIVSGLFYDDFITEDYSGVEGKENPDFRAYTTEKSSCKWMTYLWQKNGSITNDCNRPAGKGTRSAVLDKKIISNLRYTDTVWINSSNISLSGNAPQVFSSNEVSLLKFGATIYEGNIDTLISPENSDGVYFCYGNNSNNPDIDNPDIDTTTTTPFDSTAWWKTYSKVTGDADSARLYKWDASKSSWIKKDDFKIGDYASALSLQKDPVRLKYKSTAHIVLQAEENSSFFDSGLSDETNLSVLPIVELSRNVDTTTIFGGNTLDALKANKWLPAGEATPINTSGTELLYEYGDTWYSRYDCLKTYPFTQEDPNQLVEIGSFMLESRINIDGRYDRNRGQLSNINMSPTNFNLINPVYSQKDNFFTYHILDSDYYQLNTFPNQITWSLEKQPGADVDEWASMTLASTYNMDGSKGQIRSLNVWNNNIYCFQDSGVSNILFNSRVQIPTSDGVPIEIGNNYKVDGKRYISDGIGSINKFSICPTPTALYFIDSVGKHLQAINANGIADVSLQKNMVTWIGNQDASAWTPNDFTTRLFYDKNNNDVYIVTESEALCYNEAIGQFTSFMSYGGIPVMYNIVDKFYCIKNNSIYEMFAGDYNYFFGEFKEYDFTFVSNGKGGQEDLSTLDKTYSTMEFRADRWSDELDSILSSESPFDYLRVWNEYQDTGEVLLTNTPDKPSILKKKFRVWRATIPRDAHNRRDRMRNTWCKIKLGAAPRYNSGNSGFIQFHDIGVQYFI